MPFHTSTQIAKGPYIVEACETKELADYSGADALKYRDYLIAKGMAGSSVSRVISFIRAMINFAILHRKPSLQGMVSQYQL